MFKALLFLSILFHSSFATDKASFGSDDRKDVYQTDQKIKKYSTGVANWQSPVFYEINEQGLQLDFPVLGEEWGLCEKEKFRDQPTAMISCTGFLVAPDLLMTAGHCMVNIGEAKDEVTAQCSDFNWLFDFKYNRNGRENLLDNQNPQSVVGCKKVIYAIHEESGQRRDFALIKLNRKLPNRYIFPLSDKVVKKGDRVALLGHPSGLPMKFSGPARVLRTRKDAQFYEANLDSFGGNSGSPVFDINGYLKGVLVRGPADFVKDKKQNCDRWNSCGITGKNCKADDPTDNTDDWNSGMHVQRITQEIINLVNQNL